MRTADRKIIGLKKGVHYGQPFSLEIKRNISSHGFLISQWPGMAYNAHIVEKKQSVWIVKRTWKIFLQFSLKLCGYPGIFLCNYGMVNREVKP